MVARARNRWITAQAYLEQERAAETRSEYYDGVVVAMSGASPEHDRIVVNLLRHLGNQLDGTACEPFSADMRVRVPACNRYYYLDVSVVCGGAHFEALAGMRSLLNPRLIVEVLSDSTERTDRGDKFLCYQTLETLQTYVLIAQDRPQVEVYTRKPGGKWEYDRVDGLGEMLPLQAIGCALKLADVYARVDFTPARKENEDAADRE